MLKVNILKYLNDKTENYIKDKNNEEYTAQYISDIFGVKRNTISHYINQMIDEGKVIKINTRPVYFFPKTFSIGRYAIHLFAVAYSV